MASLLDNAAPGGLLSDPRIAVLQQILDPAVTKRAALLPMVRTMRPTGNTMVPEEITSREFGTPQIAVDMLGSALLPGAAAQGYTPTMQDAAQFSLDTMLGGGLLGSAPSGSLAANVWHGGPHRWAAEPGFPHGRPRLDKMGTGEGAQAYGPGFYTAESKGVGTSYRDDLTSLKRRISLDGELLPTPSAFDANKVAKDFNVPESDANYLQAIVDDMHSSVKGGDIDSYIASRKSMLDLYPENSGDEIVDMLRGSYEAQIRVAEKYKDRLKPATGSLYKLDIPDADAAKTLDWDAPLSKQPIAVREALNQSVIQRNRLDDELKKIERQINTEASLNPADASSFDSFFASPMSDKFNALIDRKIELQKEITDLPDRGFIAEVVKNNPDITGGEFFNLLKRNAGRLTGANPNRTQAESSSAVADALREAGIPGVKYLDGGSRGAGEGSRNYAIWDQDVLDRTKMLERDGVTLGANKSPTAATAGLLSRLPMDEQSRMARAEGLGFDFDGFHGTGGKDISEMSGMTWMSESPRLANEYAAMRAISSDGMASQIMPLKARTGNVFNADFLPKSVTVNQMMNEVLDQAENNLGRTFSDGEMNKARKLLGTIRKAAVREESGPNYSRHDFWNDSESIFGKDGAKAIKEIFRMSGFDSISMREGGENTIGILNPSNIRSRFAAFDPAKANSENILAANAAPLGLLSASEY